MSKRIRPWAVVYLVALALVACSLAPTTRLTGAQVATRPATKPTATTRPAATARPASVAAVTDAVLRETSDVRQLSVMRPVKSGTQSRAEIERMLVRNFEEESTPEETRAGELTLKKLGLLPPDFQLRPFLVSVLTEQILGYYDPKTKQFYLADWVDPQGQEAVIEHELTHALQDQHFNLLRFERPRKGESDADASVHALVEGDATWSMMLYMQRDLRRAFAMLRSAATAQTAKIDAAPRALRETLTFPYQQGMLWVRQLYQRGGWKAVDDAFTNLPQSTEQIMHAEKYFAREAPVKIELPDLSPTLGAGWRRIDSDVSGEWGYYLILDQFLNDEQTSRAAAAGWGGDRYALYENARTHETVLAQRTAWDTEQDAHEFFDAYVKRTERRYPGATSEIGGTPPVPADSAVFLTSEGAVEIRREGLYVAILEGMPVKADVGRLMTRMLTATR
ncbi:MAG: hypothetical protein M3268_01490 [Acidobacteriota bacterium]|nr:hypothetical protein [Acidobacteriota bacterium]